MKVFQRPAVSLFRAEEVSPEFMASRRALLKTGTGVAAGLYAVGLPGKSYQRALAQDDVRHQILAIPGTGAQPTLSVCGRSWLCRSSQNQ